MTHTRDEIMSMSAEELMSAIGEVKGYGVKQLTLNGKWYGTEPCFGHTHIFLIPDYPHDIAAAYELEGEIAEKWRPSYAILLYWVVLHEYGVRNDWDTIHATAEQRCRAYLMLMEESKDE